MNTFFTTAEAADYLRISDSSLEKWRVQGVGPKFRKHGRTVVYSRAELDAWSEAQSRQSTSESEQ